MNGDDPVGTPVHAYGYGCAACLQLVFIFVYISFYFFLSIFNVQSKIRS